MALAKPSLKAWASELVNSCRVRLCLLYFLLSFLHAYERVSGISSPSSRYRCNKCPMLSHGTYDGNLERQVRVPFGNEVQTSRSSRFPMFFFFSHAANIAVL